MEFWWIGDLVNSAVRYAVPMFLMLSGTTMLGKAYPLGEFYKKRMMRVLVPFLFWMLAYLIFRWSMLLETQQPKHLQETTNWAVGLFLSEGISKHFWYIYMLLFIYSILPFIGKALRKLNNTTILVILFGWVVITFVFRDSPLNMYSWSEQYTSKALGYALYSGYLVLGYYLSRLQSVQIKTRISAIMLFIITVAISSVATYLLSQNAQRLNLSMYSYLHLNTIFQSGALFLIVKGITIDNKIVLWLQKTISNYSYGIYLVHIMIIGILFRNGIYWSFAHPLVSLPLLTLLVLVISFGIIFLLRKIPGGKYISG
jgi:surface polysaccharide O-acyltransferase-like enzyme